MNLWAVIPLVSCICFMAILLSILPQINKRLGKVLFAFLSGSALWNIAAAVLLHDTSKTFDYLSLWTGILIASFFFLIVSYYHVVRVYNNKPTGYGVAIGYAFALVILVLSLTGFIVKDAYFTGNLLHFDIFPWNLIMLFALSPFFILSLLMLIRRYNKSIDSLDRNRTLYLAVGWTIFLILSLIATFTPSVRTVPIAHLGGIVNAVIVSYAILTRNPVNIQSTSRKLLAYVIVIMVLFGLTSALVYAYPLLSSQFSDVIIIILLTLIYTFIIFLASPFIQTVNMGVEYLFFRDTYSHRRELQDFSKKTSHIINLDELAKEILPLIANAVNIPAAGLILKNNKTGKFETQYIYPEDGLTDGTCIFKRISFDTDSPLIAYMNKKGVPLSPARINEIAELSVLPQSEKDNLTGSNIHLLLPFKSRDKLIGILALGNKKNNAVMSQEDIEIITDITNQAGIIIENAQLYTQARIRANTDELTGLYNHRHFHERIDQEITRDSRFGGTFSLIMMDVDLFKSYNDIYGHLAGDKMLRKIGEYIQKSIRRIDMAFRYGGEEFTVILPEAHIDAAYKVAERIRKTIESETSARAMPITVSLGVANWPKDGVLKEEIIGKADAALYRAKQMGRNRTSMSNGIQKQDSVLMTEELKKNPKALNIIYALAATVDAKDRYTCGHSRKVSEYAIAIANALDLAPETINNIRSAGLLHDIGKIGVPDYIFNKDAGLNDYEKEIMKEHPKLAAEILRHVVDLVSCVPAILHHHERFDGTGYPAGLEGDKIPIEARILAIADAYDAMLSPRPYRKKLNYQEALEELKKCAGVQFDPHLVEIFIEVVNSNKHTIRLKEALNQ
ncbi:MAG: diguanylate cyclase [Dehalococcoidales bacterium]|nr:diguanylate cyclase [Dehalococcoidales bacterium]